jgi:DNA (cytosine-5)-methyltransferase 1
MRLPRTIGSLCSGIGGLDLGLEAALGAEVRWQVERESFCAEILARHWPAAARFRDVRDVGAHNLERVDLICAGFPCQPHSSAGRRKGTADERWIWPEIARVLRALRPDWVVLENVPGLLTSSGGAALSRRGRRRRSAQARAGLHHRLAARAGRRPGRASGSSTTRATRTWRCRWR